MNKYFEVHAVNAYDPCSIEYIDLEKYSAALIEDVIKTLRQEWYDLNSAVPPETESARDLGIRVGRKTEVIKLIELLKARYEC